MKWHEGIEAIQESRRNYRPDQISFYKTIARQAFEFFRLQGRVLDIGCGDGQMAGYLPRCEYVGIDVILPPDHGPNLIEASAEDLPFEDAEFDSILCYSVLQHVEHPNALLSEAKRVLRAGGNAAFNICLDDNPIFMNHYTFASAHDAVEEYFEVVDFLAVGNPSNRSLLLNAVKA